MMFLMQVPEDKPLSHSDLGQDILLNMAERRREQGESSIAPMIDLLRSRWGRRPSEWID